MFKNIIKRITCKFCCYSKCSLNEESQDSIENKLEGKIKKTNI